MPFEKTIARTEAFFKGMMFDCHTCGQCVLSHTGLVCPMACPKGLRNGPCGGTLEGKCEVYPDKQCVWVRIHNRTTGADGDIGTVPKLISSPDANLYRTSSYLNYLKGSDVGGRTPLEYLDLGTQRTKQAVRTDSKLEAALKSGRFVRLCEIRSPREANMDHFTKQAELVRDHFDAVNVTAFLNGRPSLASALSAEHLIEMGIEPICQSTCRDHTKTSFVSELIQAQASGIHNMLCLTGDSYAGVPKIKQVFDMDSSLMLYEAMHLRERGVIAFTGEPMKRPPKLFLGGVVNPYSTPIEMPVRRLKQKVAAGAEFIQTQLLFDTEYFAKFMALVRQERIHEDAFIIAGVPVVISKKALAMMPHVPGVKLPDDIKAQLEAATDLRATGIELARKIVREVAAIPGVRGVHLMLFGSDHGVLKEIVHDLDDVISSSTESET